ncbi:hypothetical protein, partial [Amycolatopsis lurida]|uniref:hypothetical protein n=1 Tax=Amycolatopsis lurida TaxID=31959 RepID=UPI00365D8F2F
SWASAWDMTRDGELATRDYLDLVISGIPKESDIGVVQSLQRQVLLKETGSPGSITTSSCSSTSSPPKPAPHTRLRKQTGPSLSAATAETSSTPWEG